MDGLRDHKDLIFWQLCEQLRERVFTFTANQRVARHVDFCDDIRRSARSAPAVISEGFYRFRPRDNANYVRMALGSLGETKNHLMEAQKERYIDEEEFRRCWRLAVRAVSAGNGYHAYLRTCDPDGPKGFFPRRLEDADPNASPTPPNPRPNPNPNPEPEPREPGEPGEPL